MASGTLTPSEYIGHHLTFDTKQVGEGAFWMINVDSLAVSLLLGVIVIVMLFLAGAPLRQVGVIAGAAASLAALVILVFGGFRVQRIAAYFNPSGHQTTGGYCAPLV